MRINGVGGIYFLPLFLAFIYALPAFAEYKNQATPSDIKIINPWVRSAPPTASVLGLFMQIQNHTPNTVRLLSASAKGYQRGELHLSKQVNGVMKMIKQDSIAIKPNSTTTLKPGAFHIMLIKPKSVPNIGSKVVINLVFDNGLSYKIDAEVKAKNQPHSH